MHKTHKSQAPSYTSDLSLPVRRLNFGLRRPAGRAASLFAVLALAVVLAATPQSASAAPCAGDTAPAGAIWTACLTVGVDGSYRGYATVGSQTGSLSLNTFLQGTNSLTVENILEIPGTNFFSVNFAGVGTEFTGKLVVGDKEYLVSEAVYTSSSSKYVWFLNEVTWTKGRQVTVALVERCQQSYSGESHTQDWPFYTVDVRTRGRSPVTIHANSEAPYVVVCGHNGDKGTGENADYYCISPVAHEWVRMNLCGGTVSQDMTSSTESNQGGGDGGEDGGGEDGGGESGGGEGGSGEGGGEGEPTTSVPGGGSNQVGATPQMLILDFAHFANGGGLASDLVFVNTGSVPSRPAIYFYDTEGEPIAAESVVDVAGDLEVTDDGALTVMTEIEPLGELTIPTHGRGELVTGSVKVVSDGPIGGGLRFNLPAVGEAVVAGAGTPIGDAIFPVRRREGGITTGVAIHNLEAEPLEMSCQLMSGGSVLEEAAISLEANGQTSWLINAAFPVADTSDFSGSVRCAAMEQGLFTALALEMDDSGTRIFTTLPLFAVNRPGGGPAEVLDFAHFANGTAATSDLVFVNVSTQRSRPAIYFYDTEGALVSAESLVDITGDLTVAEDGALTVMTEIEPLGELTIATHRRGDLMTGSVKVVADDFLGGMLRFDLSDIGEAVTEAAPAVSDIIFPVRRREEGINTGVAIHNLEVSPELVRCDLLREGVLLDSVSLPLAANGQMSWLIDETFPDADTSDFTGSLRCAAVGEGQFTAIALEMDPATPTFTTLPLFPVVESTGQQ